MTSHRKLYPLILVIDVRDAYVEVVRKDQLTIAWPLSNGGSTERQQFSGISNQAV